MNNRLALRPYTGHRLDRLQNLGHAWSRDTSGTDALGTRTYNFNSLGFRGAEFDPHAEFTVFAFGESDAFGTGVELEQTWCYRVAHGEARRREVSPDNVCLMNFADGAASNASIARNVLSQCTAVRPDLVLINFAEHRRTEGFAKHRMFPAGPWHCTAAADAAAENAPEEDGQRARVKDHLVRSRAFMRFCDQDQGIYQSVRDILLVQETLAREGIQAVAIIREPEDLNRPEILNDPALGPLLARIDRRFFASHIAPRRLVNKVDWTEDGLHFGPKTHAALAERVLEHLGTTGKLIDEKVVLARDPRVVGIGEVVREFYDELPFNQHGSLEDAVKAIERPSIRNTYPDLHSHLEKRKRDNLLTLEVGCGAGWFAHGLAVHYGMHVEAIDLTPKALERARELGPLLGTGSHVRFRECNVFEFDSPSRYDLIVSLGVLHHTGDPLGALERLVRYLTPGGHIYLGLYHAPGRRVFLEEMWRIAEIDGEEAAFQRYCDLSVVHGQHETLARSWFRDQVLHPHETQHTLEEVCGWFDAVGLELCSTSINRFGRVRNRKKLFRLERSYEQRARKALSDENRYFPGFFTVFGRRA